MNLFRIAFHITASSTWFHVTQKKLLKKIVKNGLSKVSDDAKWGGMKTGDGIYLMDNIRGAAEYMNILEMNDKDAVVFEVTPPGALLLDLMMVTLEPRQVKISWKHILTLERKLMI
jgi:hypothetical protein